MRTPSTRSRISIYADKDNPTMWMDLPHLCGGKHVCTNVTMLPPPSPSVTSKKTQKKAGVIFSKIKS
jgi:hypothetical protein